MEKLYYEEPSLERKEDAIDYINENKKYNSDINGSGGLDRYLNNYEEWLLKLEQDKIVIPNEQRVPALTYFLVRENDKKIIGMVNIRLCLNRRLAYSGGNIGYGIRPTERRKGYNKINLYLALKECSKYNIDEVLISCDKDNLGSSKTMIALGARLKSEYIKDGIEEQNYIINVQESLEKYYDTYEKFITKSYTR